MPERMPKISLLLDLTPNEHSSSLITDQWVEISTGTSHELQRLVGSIMREYLTDGFKADQSRDGRFVLWLRFEYQHWEGDTTVSCISLFFANKH